MMRSSETSTSYPSGVPELTVKSKPCPSCCYCCSPSGSNKVTIKGNMLTSS